MAQRYEPQGWRSISDDQARERRREQLLRYYQGDTSYRGFDVSTMTYEQRLERDRQAQSMRRSVSPYIVEQAAEMTRPPVRELGSLVRVLQWGREVWRVVQVDVEFEQEPAYLDGEFGIARTRRNSGRQFVSYRLQPVSGWGLTRDADPTILTLVSVDQDTQERQNMERIGSRIKLNVGSSISPSWGSYADRALFANLIATGAEGTIMDVTDRSLPSTAKIRIDGMPEDLSYWLPKTWYTVLNQFAEGDFVIINKEAARTFFQSVNGRQDDLRASKLHDGTNLGEIVTYDGTPALPYEVRLSTGEEFWYPASVLSEVPETIPPIPVGKTVRFRGYSVRRGGDHSSSFVPGMIGIVRDIDSTQFNTYVGLPNGDTRWAYPEELEVVGQFQDGSHVLLNRQGLDTLRAFAVRNPAFAAFAADIEARKIAGLIYGVNRSNSFDVCFIDTGSNRDHLHLDGISGLSLVPAQDDSLFANGAQTPRTAPVVEEASGFAVNDRVIITNKLQASYYPGVDETSLNIVLRDQLVGRVTNLSSDQKRVRVAFENLPGPKTNNFWWVWKAGVQLASEVEADLGVGTRVYLLDADGEDDYDDDSNFRAVVDARIIGKITEDKDRDGDYVATFALPGGGEDYWYVTRDQLEICSLTFPQAVQELVTGLENQLKALVADYGYGAEYAVNVQGTVEKIRTPERQAAINEFRVAAQNYVQAADGTELTARVIGWRAVEQARAHIVAVAPNVS